MMIESYFFIKNLFKVISIFDRQLQSMRIGIRIWSYTIVHYFKFSVSFYTFIRVQPNSESSFASVPYCFRVQSWWFFDILYAVLWCIQYTVLDAWDGLFFCFFHFIVLWENFSLTHFRTKMTNFCKAYSVTKSYF